MLTDVSYLLFVLELRRTRCWDNVITLTYSRLTAHQHCSEPRRHLQLMLYLDAILIEALEPCVTCASISLARKCCKILIPVRAVARQTHFSQPDMRFETQPRVLEVYNRLSNLVITFMSLSLSGGRYVATATATIKKSTPLIERK